jgi:uncharacterized protein
VQQKVAVTVLEVDMERKRISLSMKEGGGGKEKRTKGKPGRPNKRIKNKGVAS